MIRDSAAVRVRRSVRSACFLGVSATVLALSMSSAAYAQSAEEAEEDVATTPSAGTTSPDGTISGSTDASQAGQPANSTVTPADDGTAADGDTIVVTGIRQSLANAQSIKRNSDTVVDAITAEDIGALPDRSVNEAIQRVPGVAITRFAAPSDSQHFSVEGSGVVIRGLGYVRGEFNGRDTFAPSGGREIGFNDVPTELVGSVEVFKNATADMIEGGIAGTVNINTRKPFDQRGQLVYLSAEANRGDLAKKWGSSFVGLFSKQWDLSNGARIGFLGSGSYSRQYNRSDSVFLASMLPRYNDDANGNGVQDAGEGRVLNPGTAFESTLFDTFPVPAGFDKIYAPVGGGSRTQDFDRKRIGISAAAQYENAARNFLLTAQFLRTDASQDWLEHTVEPNVWYPDVNQTFPAPGTSYTFNDDGVFTSGHITRTGGVPFGNVLQPDGTYAWGELSQFTGNGMFTTFSNRVLRTQAITNDFSVNTKWSPYEGLRFNFDAQLVKAKAKGMDDIVDTATFSQVAIDLRDDIPQIELRTPGFDTNEYFASPNRIYFRDAFNNRNDNDGKEVAFRGDMAYDVSDTGFIRAVRAGARYSNRKQTVRTNDYNNWGSTSDTWSPRGIQTFADIPAEYGELFNYSNFFRGDAVTPPDAVYIPESIMRDHDALSELLRLVTAQAGGNYTPLEDRGDNLIRGYFRPNEIYKNDERTIGGYVRADFGVEDLGGMGLTGNIGLRYVATRNRSYGAVTFPTPNNIFTPDTTTPPRYTTLAEFCAYRAANPQPGQTMPIICTISPQQQEAALAFANGGSADDVARNDYDHWLPSLNLKLQVTDQFLMRFAASKAISRPNFGDMRNYIGVSVAPNNTPGNFGFNASSRNPFLEPIEAKQFDLTGEWYFAKVGSLTGALFYKKLSGIILDNAAFIRPMTNNGATFDVMVNGPANAGGDGSVKGAELSYQQTYDFLPGALRGLGAQATVTYVKPSSIPNGNPANGPGDGSRPPLDVTGIYDNLPLSGFSKWNVNLAAFYDLGRLQARLAYSWRSKYLLTQRDCCFPFLPVYALSSGYADASLFYDITKNIKVGAQVQNLLDTTTKTVFVLDPNGATAPRSWFKSDRQFSFVVRTKW